MQTCQSLRLRLLGLALCLCAAGGRCQTTVPVFLPGYHGADWDVLRGSVVSSDKSTTVFTIFCAQQTPLSCELAGDLPFQFAEGPGTLDFGGSAAGKITADLNCVLAGTTAATCTGSTSWGSTYTEGSITGPTQTVWTSTLTGSDADWGVLTLATPGTGVDTTNIEGTAMEAPTATRSGATTTPNAASHARGSWAKAGAIGAALAGLLVA
ncbi:hypothetical protein GQ53DRAFT_751674 [Thozetella sp. PMI_491]|nr:hypothetical protein GQ53DRAFT_751674 [Thozetella sp. PMI_491]